MCNRYLSAENETHDDFAQRFTGVPGEVVYDAVTHSGAWAMMTEASFQIYGRGKLGLGLGQRYVRNEEGHLILDEETLL